MPIRLSIHDPEAQLVVDDADATGQLIPQRRIVVSTNALIGNKRAFERARILSIDPRRQSKPETSQKEEENGEVMSTEMMCPCYLIDIRTKETRRQRAAPQREALECCSTRSWRKFTVQSGPERGVKKMGSSKSDSILPDDPP